MEAYELKKAIEFETRIEAAAAKGLTKFAGRKNSMATLMEAYGKAKSGSGQVVGVVGEAGVGKSRLLIELRNVLSKEEYTYLEGRCLHYGGSMAYLPILDILRSYFEIKEEDRENLIKKKMEEKISQLDENLKETLFPLQDLLALKVEDEAYFNLEAKEKRDRAFEAIRDLLIRESQNSPLVLVVEGLHWIDKTSEEILDYLIGWLTNARILLILLYRPEYTHNWGSKSYYTKVGLNQLTTKSGAQLVQAILENGETVLELRELILNRASGNPLFIEELTYALLENGSIQKKNNKYILSRKVSDIQVPHNIQGIIAARLDRLEESLKEIIQVASVIGREFAFRTLQTISGMREELKSHLQNLQGLEFICEKRLFPELEYIFKHALTQEVAYNSLLSTRRARLHRAIGLAMEELYDERLAERYEELAHHFTLGEDWEKAFDYLTKSGDKSRQTFAHHEAAAFYTHAIEVSDRITSALDDAQLLSVYEGRGLVWMLQTKYDKAIADFQMMLQIARASANQQKEGESLCHLAYAHWLKLSVDHMPFVEQYAQEAVQLYKKTGDQKIHARALESLGLVEQVRGNLQEADKKFEESLQICRQEGYKDTEAHNLLWLSAHATWQGNFQRSIQLGQEGLTVSREIHDGLNELFNLSFLCLANWGAGNYAQALNVLHEGMTKAKERDNKFMVGRLTNTLGWFHSEFGDIARAIEYDQESNELGRMYRVSNVEISALINLGLDYFLLGQYERALSYLQPTLDRVQREAFGAHRWRWTIRLLIVLADVHYATGAYSQALRHVEEGLKEARATSSQKYVAKGLALRGKIVEKLGDSDAAGAELQRAHTLAEQLHSPALIYRIAYDLGQWYETAGQEQESSVLYGKAKTAAEHMATAIEDEVLRSIFLHSAPVQAIKECMARMGGY